VKNVGLRIGKTFQNHPGVWGSEIASMLTAGKMIGVIASLKTPKGFFVTFFGSKKSNTDYEAYLAKQILIIDK
jgi:hypothetical protein